MATTDVTDSGKQAVKELISDGVEFEEVRNCLLAWFSRQYGVSFARGRNGWATMQEGLNRTYHRSFHEMLQYLLDTYVTPTP